MAQITTQMSDEMVETIIEIAQREGSSKSEFIRRAAIHYVKKEYPEDYRKVVNSE